MSTSERRDDPPAPPAGIDVDPRVTFANERTFLAWVRTALALIAGGVAVGVAFETHNQQVHAAVALCPIVLGGAVGVLGGVTLSMTVARMAGWITSIDGEAIALALAFSIATGLIFGFYPAHKASKLSPIEALKTE